MAQTCAKCRKPSHGKYLCIEHAAKASARAVLRRAAHHAAGLCIDCPKPTENGHARCADCIKKDADRRDARRVALQTVNDPRYDSERMAALRDLPRCTWSGGCSAFAARSRRYCPEHLRLSAAKRKNEMMRLRTTPAAPREERLKRIADSANRMRHWALLAVLPTTWGDRDVQVEENVYLNHYITFCAPDAPWDDPRQILRLLGAGLYRPIIVSK